MKKYYVGIDVGGTKIAYGLFDQDHQLLDKYLIKTKAGLTPEIFIQETSTDINLILKKNKIEKKSYFGAGIVFPGHVDFEKGLLITTSNIPQFYDKIPFKKIFTEKLGCRIEIDNDANAAALAEHKFGSGKGHKNMLYVTISTGIGGGIIINNQLFRGSYGAAGEFGHMIISEDDYICGCGNKGCAMALASGPQLVKYAKEKIKTGISTTLLECIENHDLTCREIGEGALNGDDLCCEIINRTGDILGILFANLYQIFNLDTIVVGGGVSKLGKILFDRIEIQFKKLSKIADSYPVRIIPAKLGDDSGIIGASLLLTDEF